jgi:hypothetical protein
MKHFSYYVMFITTAIVIIQGIYYHNIGQVLGWSNCLMWELLFYFNVEKK